jgi:predicted nucleic acid-binding protein
MDFKIVVDASIAVKWYIRDEIDADRAIDMLLDYEKGAISEFPKSNNRRKFKQILELVPVSVVQIYA